jgi:hypothetical protein
MLSPDRPARSQSLQVYRLSYPTHTNKMYLCLINILIITMSSICFEPEGSSSGRLYVQVRYRLFTCNGISSLAKTDKHPILPLNSGFLKENNLISEIWIQIWNLDRANKTLHPPTRSHVHKPPYWREVLQTQESYDGCVCYTAIQCFNVSAPDKAGHIYGRLKLSVKAAIWTHRKLLQECKLAFLILAWEPLSKVLRAILTS